MKREHNPSAFPFTYYAHNSVGEWGPQHQEAGMTLRDYFAAAALQGFLAYSHPKTVVCLDTTVAANFAYECADAMLAARKEGQ